MREKEGEREKEKEGGREEKTKERLAADNFKMTVEVLVR